MREKKRIIAHRGLWHSRPGSIAPLHKNSLEAFSKAIEFGFGLETDFRDRSGDLVLAHDVSDVVAALGANKCFELINSDDVIAANLKSTGLVDFFPKSIRNLDGFFFFDMPFPEALSLHERGESIALRVSEYETLPEHLIQPKWVWLDYWKLEDHLDEAMEFIKDHGSTRIVVVSPELHGLDPQNVWKQISEEMKQNENLYICTDYPEEFLELLQ